jgi:hypothetical protein
MMRFLIGLVALLLAAAFLAANFRAVTTDVRATIAEPATSTTSVVATSGLAASNATATGALATALVVQQLTLCVIPLAILVVIALLIIAFIIARRHPATALLSAQDEQARQIRQPPVVVIERAANAPSQSDFNALMIAPRRKRRVRVNHVARLAGRMFR